MTLAILILAAGRSSRMGGPDKLMQNADGLPLLTRVIQQAKATNLPVLTTLPDLFHPRAALVRNANVTPVIVPDWSTGMAASIRAGVAALPKNTDAVMILPGDMPDLRTQDLRALAVAHAQSPGTILQATSSTGTPGHPVIFPADLFDELRALQGDTGARPVIKAHPDRRQTHALQGNRALCDLDTPADWADWIAKQQPSKGQKGGPEN